MLVVSDWVSAGEGNSCSLSYLSSLLATFVDDSACSVPRWSAAYMPVLTVNLYSQCPRMQEIKRKPWLVISLQLFPALAKESYLQLWSQSHRQCLKRCCHQLSASSLNSWAASNYSQYQEAFGAGHWGREQCAWHKCQKPQGRLGTQACPYLTATSKTLL